MQPQVVTYVRLVLYLYPKPRYLITYNSPAHPQLEPRCADRDQYTKQRLVSG